MANRDENGRFVTGNTCSTGTGGRPKGQTRINELVEQIGSLPYEGNQTKLEAVITKMYNLALEGDNVKAGMYLLDRLAGRPHQSIAMTNVPDVVVMDWPDA